MEKRKLKIGDTVICKSRELIFENNPGAGYIPDLIFTINGMTGNDDNPILWGKGTRKSNGVFASVVDLYSVEYEIY